MYQVRKLPFQQFSAAKPHLLSYPNSVSRHEVTLLRPFSNYTRRYYVRVSGYELLLVCVVPTDALVTALFLMHY